MLWVAAFLESPVALASVAPFDGWFPKAIDPPGLLAACRIPPCRSGAPADATQALAPSAVAWSEWDELLQASVVLPTGPSAVLSMDAAGADGPEAWACLVPAFEIPADSQSAGSTGFEGRELDPDIASSRVNPEYDPNAWPLYSGLCLLIAVGFVALALCCRMAQGGAAAPSGRRRVQSHDSAGQVLVDHVAEPSPAHLFSQLVSPGKPAHRLGQVRVGIPAAR